MRLRRSLPRLLALTSLLALSGCGPSNSEAPPRPPLPQPVQPPPQPQLPPPLPPEPKPETRLPADTKPTHYKLSLTILPDTPRFSGAVDIAVTLDRPRDVIWLHGRDLSVKQVTLQQEGTPPVVARWEQASPAGLAAIRLPSPVGAGRYTLHIDYDAPFGERQEALFHLQRGGKSYAFTQFESIFARRAFPCFDEPAFKTPYDITLTVPQGQEAVSNTHEVSRAAAPGGLTSVTFATTAPLPSYLLAFAVGPLDVVSAPPIPPNAVRKRPLPFRGVAVGGRGKELSYALAHTPEIIAALEDYFGIEYPYDKLDIIAVPEKGGAMENAGAVTFGEWLILLDEKSAPEDQRWAFSSVTAHELAHQWFGDLVTMPWWDDTWLNEAFATWMARRITSKLYPEFHADIRGLDGIHNAMGTDALVSARQIRQEVRDENDIFNAFDSITYQKGGGVIGMFERWIGADVFRKGVSAYMNQHRFGNATEADLLSSLSAAAGRDVMTPFRSFLFQPGVPLVEATVDCSGKPTLKLRQSRFLPIGSTGDEKRTWQVPVCAHYPDGDKIKESCTLLADREGALPLEGAACPAWVMPNAEAAGYYRWTLDAENVKKLATAGYAKLDPLERMSFASSLRVGFVKGTTPAGDVLRALAPFAADPNHAVARGPMDLLGGIDFWFEKDAALRKSVEAYGQRLYAPVYQDVGWEPKKGKKEDSERPLLRQAVIEFLAEVAKDPKVRKEAAARGRAYLGVGKDGALHPEAVDPDLVDIALTIAGEEADAALFDAALSKLLAAQSESVRRNLVSALGSVTKPELAARARELVLDQRLQFGEALGLLYRQFRRPETRDAAWEWLKAHLEPVTARYPPEHSAGMVWFATAYCDQEHVDEEQRIFGQRIQSLEGGPREFAIALESMNLCIARRKVQEPNAREFFGGKDKGKAASASPAAAPAKGAPAKGAPGKAPAKKVK